MLLQPLRYVHFVLSWVPELWFRKLSLTKCWGRPSSLRNAPAAAPKAAARNQVGGQPAVPNATRRVRTPTSEVLNAKDLYDFNLKDKIHVLHHSNPGQWTDPMLQGVSNEDATETRLHTHAHICRHPFLKLTPPTFCLHGFGSGYQSLKWGNHCILAGHRSLCPSTQQWEPTSQTQFLEVFFTRDMLGDRMFITNELNIWMSWSNLIYVVSWFQFRRPIPWWPDRRACPAHFRRRDSK